MKNITFTADETLIRKAREKARMENTSLNRRFREWLNRYANQEIEEVLSKVSYAKAGK